MVLGAAIIAMLVSIIMVVIRGILGPTIFDRILSANLFGTNIIVLIVLMGHYMGTDFFLDIALTYALINFVSTIALLRYFKYEEANK
jgi:multicomponent Na+:H+ antiporter subunit F